MALAHPPRPGHFRWASAKNPVNGLIGPKTPVPIRLLTRRPGVDGTQSAKPAPVGSSPRPVFYGLDRPWPLFGYISLSSGGGLPVVEDSRYDLSIYGVIPGGVLPLHSV
ncbi:hypothetical protein [Spirosoma pollinicola]|uniref:hypothetical protein n=1 Tax=Spirosoma pollinicola TaxID=2057025 RepID=UPI0012FE4BBF|nr:hypothetical protein [Spirosoma pollinicola]